MDSLATQMFFDDFSFSQLIFQEEPNIPCEACLRKEKKDLETQAFHFTKFREFANLIEKSGIYHDTNLHTHIKQLDKEFHRILEKSDKKVDTHTNMFFK